LSNTPPPFAAYEWMIAWRYLRSKRAEGGVSVMTWISLIGITLAVFALIATLSVRSGFRAEFVDTILGANAHATVYQGATVNENGQMDRSISEYDTIAARLAPSAGSKSCGSVDQRSGDGLPPWAQCRRRSFWYQF